MVLDTKVEWQYPLAHNVPPRWMSTKASSELRTGSNDAESEIPRPWISRELCPTAGTMEFAAIQSTACFKFTSYLVRACKFIATEAQSFSMV